MQTCRLCDQPSKLCKSHVISEFLFKPLYDKDHQFIDVFDVSKGRVKKSQSGWKERLLCASCESKINRFEKNSRRLFTDPLPALKPGHAIRREFPRVDYSMLKLFFLSILWRASVSSLDVFQHVDLGPHEDKIKALLLRADPGDALVYPTLFFNIHFDGQHFRDYMVQPTYVKIEGRKCYRFLLSGFLVYIFVSSQPLPGKYPEFVLSPQKTVCGYDMEFSHFRFLRDAWNLAGRTTRNVEI
jgi:hypothetical protein